MIQLLRSRQLPRIALVLALAGGALPALAQDAANTDARLRKVESEVRALQRQVFPGPDGKFFTPQVEPAQGAAQTIGAPATTPVTDLLARVDALETALARLTSQTEENANKLAKLEARLDVLAPPAAVVPATATPAAATTDTPAASSNLEAMTGGASAPKPAPAAVTPPPPAAITPAPKPLVITPPAAKPAAAAPKPAAPSAQRLAAVRAVEKPKTADAGDDEYSYGFRLWEAKLHPEAQQQLKLYLEKYPKHAKLSFARNLIGRSLLDEAKPRDAAQWFLQNYQADKKGDRAPDSLLFLAESMRQLKDVSRACIALAEFSDTYPREAAGRLKAQYDVTRLAVKCN